MATQYDEHPKGRWLGRTGCRTHNRRSRSAHGRASRPLAVEQLEDRTLLAAIGAPWADARHLSLSFAPDGTRVGAQKSNLFKTLDAQMPRAQWQREILRAFQTWSVQANINVSLEADNGAPFGTPGPTQGDPRFGDIRVGAHLMSRDVVSVSIPPDQIVSGTWAGDVLLNSSYSFNSPSVDLFSMMLHEAGHVFGLEHSTDPNSVMFAHTGVLRTGLAPGDIAAIRSLYGARTPDAAEADIGNETFDTATPIETSPNSRDGSLPLVRFGDITTAGDVDVFSWRPIPDYLGPVTIRVQSAGVSLLAPRLRMFDDSGHVLGQAESRKVGGSVRTVLLPQVNPQATYFVKVEGATTDVFGIGSYGLAVTSDAKLTVSQSAIDAVLRGPNEGLTQEAIDQLFNTLVQRPVSTTPQAGDSCSTAIVLKTTPGFAPNRHFEAIGSIADRTDIDVYQVKSPKADPDETLFLTAIVRTADVNGTVPRLTVTDRKQNFVNAEVLVNGNGTYMIQVANATPGSRYYVVVQPGPAPSDPTVNYTLSVDFDTVAANLRTLVISHLSNSVRQATGTLYVAQSQLLQFSLSASTDALLVPADASVRVSIADRTGTGIFEISTLVRDTFTGNSVLLAPGPYSVRFVISTSTGALLPEVTFKLRGASLSEPIGPRLQDPTDAPLYVCPGGSPPFCYPGGITSPHPLVIVLA